MLFTALAVETSAVTAHLVDLEPIRWAEEVHQRGRFEEGIGWEVIVVQTEPENQNAAVTAESALLTLAPAIALFVGIAGGFSEKGVKTGDLVIPATVDYYQAGRADDSFTPRGRQYRCTRYMSTAARQVAREQRWGNRLDASLDAVPQVHFEPLASGDHVVKSLDSDTYRHIRTHLDKAVAVDMEASGFLTATSMHQDVQSAVIRGISDLLSDKDLARDVERQPEAARRAAAFAFELLATAPRDVLRIRPQPVAVSSWGSAVAEMQPAEVPVESTAPPDVRGNRGALAVRLGDELGEILGIDHWQRQTNGIFFGSPPDVPAKFDERLESAAAWISRRVALDGLDEVLEAIANLGAVIRDFRDVFHQQVEPTAGGQVLRVVQFYRQYDKAVAERERLLEEYERHVLLIKDLGAEMTRAVNLVDARIRVLEPSYRVMQGVAGIFAGADESLVVVTYTEDEARVAQPYPGLAEFEAALGTRDGSFGPYRGREELWPETALDRLDDALTREDLPAAQGAAFDFAALTAESLGDAASVDLDSGVGRGHRVRLRQVTVRWNAQDGSRVGTPTKHLTRVHLTPRGEPDPRGERLVGSPQTGVVGEVLGPSTATVTSTFRNSDLVPFSREARELLDRLQFGAAEL